VKERPVPLTFRARRRPLHSISSSHSHSPLLFSSLSISQSMMHQRRRAEKETAFTSLKKFDAYAKTLDDFRVKTSTGAIGRRMIDHADDENDDRTE